MRTDLEGGHVGGWETRRRAAVGGDVGSSSRAAQRQMRAHLSFRGIFRITRKQKMELYTSHKIELANTDNPASLAEGDRVLDG